MEDVSEGSNWYEEFLKTIRAERSLSFQFWISIVIWTTQRGLGTGILTALQLLVMEEGTLAVGAWALAFCGTNRP